MPTLDIVIKGKIKNILNKFGYDIVHLPSDPFVRQKMSLLKKYKIDLIFDIGANTGQYATELRSCGYRGRIISFEPLPDAYDKLAGISEVDTLWETAQIALGNRTGERILHISKNSYSSSILEILPRHVESAPESEYIGEITVPVRTVDDIIDQYLRKGENIFIKIDTQGFERQVYEGCTMSLNKITGFQMELSLVPLYEGETLMQEMINLLRDSGYRMILLGPGHQDYFTGEILQVEAIFIK